MNVWLDAGHGEIAPHTVLGIVGGFAEGGALARIIRERGATLTPTLALGEGEGAVPIPSPPEGERDRVRGSLGRGTRIRE